MQTFLDSLPTILTALTATVAAASAIATAFGKPDNKYLGYAHDIVNFLALNFGQAKNAADVKPTDAPKS